MVDLIMKQLLTHVGRWNQVPRQKKTFKRGVASTCNSQGKWLPRKKKFKSLLWVADKPLSLTPSLLLFKSNQNSRFPSKLPNYRQLRLVLIRNNQTTLPMLSKEVLSRKVELLKSTLKSQTSTLAMQMTFSIHLMLGRQLKQTRVHSVMSFPWTLSKSNARVNLTSSRK